jgi:hypothetical protein
MEDSEPAPPVAPQEVQQLRHLTGAPWMECKQWLASLSVAERQRLIETIGNHQPGVIMHDPIEDDPAIRPLFLAVCEEATREIEELQHQEIDELNQQSPDVAELLQSGRGKCHRIWARIKELLRERHGIEWRSPRELNPWVIFD